MDKDELNRRIAAGNFVENNGAILRTINILKVKFNKLKSISYALDVERGDIEKSVNYLYEAGYIHLRHIDTKRPTSLADTEFDKLEAKLTQKGIQLLAGVIEDECVEV
ncbi:MAG: type VI secretion protein [Ruminococcus sp.]|nr:type VI secretion protein [Ruminococcus sp.]